MRHVRVGRVPAAMSLALVLAVLGLVAALAEPAHAAAEGRPCAPEPTDEEIFYGELITCDIVPKGDSDVFRFQGVVGEQVFATTARPSGNVSPCIQLFRPSGGTPVASGCTASGRTFTIGATLDETGPWTITVTDGGSPNEGPYTLVLDRLAPAPPAAEPVDYGATIVGEIDPIGDADLFVIGGGLGSTISIQTARVNGLVQPCIALYDPDGALVAADCHTVGNSFAVSATLAQEGIYTIHVADRGNNERGTYSLTLQCLAGTCPNLHTLTLAVGPAGTPNPVKSGGTAALAVTAVDSFDHPLTYAWTANCPPELESDGTFDDPTLPTPTWTAPVNPTGSEQACTIEVAVADDRGLTKVGSYAQKIHPILPPDITVAPLALDFGDVPVGTTSAPQTITVTNDGLTDNLVIKSVSLTGVPFKKASDGCSNQTLAPGQSCAVEIVFNPGSTGTKTSTLSIPSNDPDASENPVRVSLTGAGVATSPSGEPDIAVAPTSLDFGTVSVGTASADQMVTVTNEGTASLAIKSVSVGSTAFKKVGDTCSNQTLPPGQSCTVSVQFKPATAGTKSSTLTIPSNDPDEKSVKVALTGAAVKGGGGGGGGGTPDIAVSPTALDFGGVPVGTASAAQTVTVSNEGTADLKVKSISVVGTQFKKTGDTCSGQILPPGGSCTVSVYLKPTIKGAKSSNLSIPSTDPDSSENPVKVPLTGEGL